MAYEWNCTRVNSNIHAFVGITYNENGQTDNESVNGSQAGESSGVTSSQIADSYTISITEVASYTLDGDTRFETTAEGNSHTYYTEGCFTSSSSSMSSHYTDNFNPTNPPGSHLGIPYSFIYSGVAASTTVNSTFAYVYNTTTADTITVTNKYTSASTPTTLTSLTGSSHITYTSSTITSAYTSYSTTTVSNDTTSSSIATVLTNKSTTVDYRAEIGTVVQAWASEWLWAITEVPTSSISASDTNFYVVSDIAVSFTQKTFWPIAATVSVPYVGVSSDLKSSTPLLSFTNAASTTKLTGMYFIGEYTTSSSSVTSGDIFPRNTTESDYGVFSIYTTNITVGFSNSPLNSSSGAAIRTMATTGGASGTDFLNLTAQTTIKSTILFATGLDQTTTTVGAFTTTYQTYNFKVSTPNTFISLQTDTASTLFEAGSFASSDTGETNLITFNYTISSTASTGISLSSTSVQVLSVGAASSVNSTQAFQRVPIHGAFRVATAIEQTDGAGGNITIFPAVYYPFTSSVQQNVIVPIPTNTTTFQTDTNKYSTSSDTDGNVYSIYTNLTRWNYSWSDINVSYTSATSFTTSSSNTVANTSTSGSSWNTTSTTGNFQTVSSVGGEYWQSTGNVIGGFSPISSAPEIAVVKGGFLAISYNSEGRSTTNQTIYQSNNTFTISNTALEERVNPVYSTAVDAGAGLPIIAFTR